MRVHEAVASQGAREPSPSPFQRRESPSVEASALTAHSRDILMGASNSRDSVVREPFSEIVLYDTGTAPEITTSTVEIQVSNRRARVTLLEVRAGNPLPAKTVVNYPEDNDLRAADLRALYRALCSELDALHHTVKPCWSFIADMDDSANYNPLRTACLRLSLKDFDLRRASIDGITGYVVFTARNEDPDLFCFGAVDIPGFAQASFTVAWGVFGLDGCRRAFHKVEVSRGIHVPGHNPWSYYYDRRFIDVPSNNVKDVVDSLTYWGPGGPRDGRWAPSGGDDILWRTVTIHCRNGAGAPCRVDGGLPGVGAGNGGGHLAGQGGAAPTGHRT